MIDIETSKASGRLDMVVDNGEAGTVEAFDELEQRVEFKLEFFQNDWFLDLGFGLPYYGQVFRRGVDVDSLYGMFELAISEEPGIERVQDISVELDSATRTIRVGGRMLASSGDELEFTTTNGEI